LTITNRLVNNDLEFIGYNRHHKEYTLSLREFLYTQENYSLIKHLWWWWRESNTINFI